MDSEILVIIPAYNESKNIEKVISEITNLKEKMNLDYLVVNDCSTDSTEKICKDSSYNYVSLKNNLGIGGRYKLDIDTLSSMDMIKSFKLMVMDNIM